MTRSKIARSKIARGDVVRAVPAPVAAVITSVAAVEITATSVIITWTLDQFATGQVNYGTTASYGSSTTAESSLSYNSHAQAITGLTPATEYHYRVRSTNVDSVETVSGDYTFTTLAASGAYPEQHPLVFVTMNSDTMPTYLGTITDSTWGTTHRRITDVHLRRNGYPTNQAWSKDGTWLYLPGRTSASLRRLLDGQTYADIGSVTTLPQQIIWSNTDDNKGYGIHQSLRRLYTWDPNTRTTQSILADFSATGGGRRADQPADWTYIEAGGVWNISEDDHLVGFWATRSDGSFDAVAYDPVDDRIEAYLNYATADKPTAVVTSIDGTYMIVDTGTSAAGNRQRRIYTMTARVGSTPGTFTYVRAMPISGGSHGLPGVDHLGNQVWFRAGGYGDMFRLDTGATTQLVPASTCVSGGHVGYAIGRPGYAYWSVDHVASASRVTEKGYGQLIATPTSSVNPDVEVYGCHHNMVSSAAAAAAGDELRLYAAPNRNGKLVLYGSDWHGETAYSGNVYAFVAGMNA